jgi:two-component sensor histidine kinase
MEVFMIRLFFLSILSLVFVTNLPTQKPEDRPSKDSLLSIEKSRPDTSRIGLLLKSANYYHFKPFAVAAKRNWYKLNQDSAINLLTKALQLSANPNNTDQQFSILELIAECEADFNPEHAKQILLNAANYYHRRGERSKEALAYERLADAYFKNHKVNDNHYKKISYYQHARSLYSDNHEAVAAARVLTKIAAQRIPLKQYDQAEKDLQKSLAEYKAVGSTSLQYTYITFVDLEYTKGNYYRAMAYCLLGIKSRTSSESIRCSSYFYWNAARCNFATKRNEDALNWLTKAISLDGSYPDYNYLMVDILLEDNRIEEAITKINRIAKAKFPHTSWDIVNLYRCLALYHAKKNQTIPCVEYYLKSLNMSKKIFGDGGYSWKLICYNGIAEAYLKDKQVIKAKRYLKYAQLVFQTAETHIDPAVLVDYYYYSNKYNPTAGEYRAAFKNAKTPLSRGLLLNYYKILYKCDTAEGNYREAFWSLQQHHRLYDSLSTLDKNYKIEELNIHYRSAQKELSIKDLKSQGMVQQAKLKTANLERNITIGGIFFMVLVSTLVYRNYRQKNKANNIISEKNALLQHLLTEKEWLLKELHHRIKNNLHTVISLLESQAKYLENDALKAIESSQHRIYAMSLIHQKLYLSDNIETIDMSSYIPELVQSMDEGFDMSPRVSFQTNIQSIHLPISHAIPLGLIINEAITNSLKHAFPNNRNGQIIITMLTHGNSIHLELADNGVGMPPTNCEVAQESLGLRLIKGLSQDIDANITFSIKNGTKIIVTFSLDAYYDSEKIKKLVLADQLAEVGISKS